MIPPKKYASTNFVPAVAVIRKRLVLAVMTGRKGGVGGRTNEGAAQGNRLHFYLRTGEAVRELCLSRPNPPLEGAGRWGSET